MKNNCYNWRNNKNSFAYPVQVCYNVCGLLSVGDSGGQRPPAPARNAPAVYKEVCCFGTIRNRNATHYQALPGYHRQR